jgi:hypothetical protein
MLVFVSDILYSHVYNIPTANYFPFPIYVSPYSWQCVGLVE